MKHHINELAIFGGPRAFDQPLHVGRPNLGDRGRLLARIDELLDRRWFTNDGPLVQEFERRLAEWTGAKHCIAVCNGTVALELALRAAGVEGDVIMPAFTFVATAHAVQWLGLQPVFCDIDAESHTIDPGRIEQLITPRTAAIVGVHLWGRPCRIDRLQAIADRHGLTLLFDAAHAFGCTWRGRPIGNFGLAEVFSFHATKFVNAFEGGAIVTNDDQLAARLRLMRNFGFAGYDQVVSLGINGKMSEVSAAMGLTSLDSCHEFIAANRQNHEAYVRELSGVSGLSMLDYDAGERANYQYIVVEVDAEKAGLARDDLVEVLWAENVLARRYFYPGCHRMAPYAAAGNGWRLPVTDSVAGRVLSLPTGGTVGFDQVAAVCNILRTALADAGEVGRQLARLKAAAT
ncbi:MAG TPA: aminotransferase class I/II-fold pyridoxal phosphate-dependent enzyme [Pirellulales bacterium]|nr:aminotransferase class I/II-fold pyridoxal phosphate-dependent enzyme [Pirellulales bacterium]